jgi:catechol 2,3-dioxygenase-like lactoylglutathione lyase family enzyme
VLPLTDRDGEPWPAPGALTTCDNDRSGWELYGAYISAFERGEYPEEVSAAAGLYIRKSEGLFPDDVGLADSEIERTPMSGNDGRIDYADLPAPSDGFLVTLFITVRKVARSRAFYTEVLGGTVVLEENPCIVKLANSWIIMNPGGPPTPDKPDITVVNYEPGDTTSIFLNLRVADIDACYREWSDRGATFLTPPIDRGAEIRCYMRDPDGYLIEVGQATGILSGHLAAKRPEDLPG